MNCSPSVAPIDRAESCNDKHTIYPSPTHSEKYTNKIQKRNKQSMTWFIEIEELFHNPDSPLSEKTRAAMFTSTFSDILENLLREGNVEWVEANRRYRMQYIRTTTASLGENMEAEIKVGSTLDPWLTRVRRGGYECARRAMNHYNDSNLEPLYEESERPPEYIRLLFLLEEAFRGNIFTPRQVLDLKRFDDL